jgi:hypothetical protein
MNDGLEVSLDLVPPRKLAVAAVAVRTACSSRPSASRRRDSAPVLVPEPVAKNNQPMRQQEGNRPSERRADTRR